MRVVKDGEERKKELLEAARRLFITKGYERTSVNDIIQEVGIKKGTFYYYFTSKEEILEEMVLEEVRKGAERARAILQQETIPILLRIVMAIQAQTPDGEDMEGVEMLHDEMTKPENAKLDQVYLRTMIKELTAVMEESVQEAVRQGIIQTEYPTEGIEITLLLAQEMLNRPTFNWGEAGEMRKMQIFLYYIQRILGIREEEVQQLSMMLQGDVQ